MPPPHEERPRPDEDRVREAMKEHDEREDPPPAESDDPAPEDLDADPAYNPDDPGLKDIKGG
jgi:hypothetical protein